MNSVDALPPYLPPVNEAAAQKFLQEITFIVDSLFNLSIPLEDRMMEVVARRERTVMLLHSMHETSNPFTHLLEYRYPKADPDIMSLCAKALIDEYQHIMTPTETLDTPGLIDISKMQTNHDVLVPGEAALPDPARLPRSPTSFHDSGIGTSYHTTSEILVSLAHDDNSFMKQPSESPLMDHNPRHPLSVDGDTASSAASDMSRLTLMNSSKFSGSRRALLPSLPKPELPNGVFTCPICQRKVGPIGKSQWKQVSYSNLDHIISL